jgi:peptidoglycan-associated lipoprotein
MRKQVCLAVTLGVILIIVLFAASCSKQVAKTQMEPIVAPEPTTEPEIKKAMPEISKEKDQLAELFEEDRIRAKVFAAHEAAEKAFVNENIHFAFNSALLSDQARQILNDKADYLRTNPDIKITIEGHADDRGKNIYNLALGEKRAVSVKKFLFALGIGADRLDTVSYGEERPIAMGHNGASWARNRRAQFVIN